MSKRSTQSPLLSMLITNVHRAIYFISADGVTHSSFIGTPSTVVAVVEELFVDSRPAMTQVLGRAAPEFVLDLCR